MKRSHFFHCITIIIAFLSLGLVPACSGSHTADVAFFDKETLRDISMGREKETVWTRELESVRLVRDISEIPQVSKDIPLEPLVVAVADTGKSLTYPALAGFGSLDTGSISSELLCFLDAFCNAIGCWEIPSKNMSDNALFSIILFRHDIVEGWRAEFDAEFPVQKREAPQEKQTPTTAAQDATTQDGNDTKKEDAQKKDTPPAPIKKPEVFTSALYGAPFIEADRIAVPIRFYAAEGYVDTELFLTTGATPAVADGERKNRAAESAPVSPKSEAAKAPAADEAEKPAKKAANTAPNEKATHPASEADATEQNRGKTEEAANAAKSGGDRAQGESSGKKTALPTGDFKINQIQIMRWGKNGK